MKLIFSLYFLVIVNLYLFNIGGVQGALTCAARASTVLIASDVRMANTHVIPVEGKTWTIKDKNVTLTLLSNKESLLLAKFVDQSLVYYVSVWNDEVLMGKLLLDDPSKLPGTESNGAKYSTSHHSAVIKKEWMRPNMKIQFSTMLLKSEFIFPNVGQEINMKMWLLPFYLFGANDTNTQPLSVTGTVNKNITDELVEKWSLSTLEVANHPISRIDWPYIILPPGRNGLAALRITNSDQKRDGYEIMSVVLQLLGGIRGANGEGPSSILYYTPLLHLGANGKYADPWGGLGGGSRGTGDYTYSGIFIHEAGHSFGLPHAGDAYDSGNFPYVRGSLLGSEWGYDKNHKEFLTVNIPTQSGFYKNCNKSAVLDSNNQCIKQSVMQGGSGSQSNGYRFSMFADYEMTTIQGYFRDSIYYDKSIGGYKKWDTKLLKYLPYIPSTKSNGIWGVNDGLPLIRDVDVYTIIITYSYVGPSELSQIYPLMKNKGNIMETWDPTNATQMAEIKPNISKYAWFCHSSGCDYTVKITYSDSSTKYILLQQGKRVYWAPSGAFRTGFNDPLSGDSFMTVTLNAKADKKITQVDLYETLLGFNGFFANNATLLVSQTF